MLYNVTKSFVSSNRNAEKRYKKARMDADASWDGKVEGDILLEHFEAVPSSPQKALILWED